MSHGCGRKTLLVASTGASVQGTATYWLSDQKYGCIVETINEVISIAREAEAHPQLAVNFAHS